ncbi:MAG: insulinase family protein [Lachnospiraceae bacterium]|nr:insulinase family protein [Lachnospiraceae bacterium]
MIKNIPAAYELIKQEKLTDVHSDGTVLRHKKSGATIALVENDDDNKVFYIGFRTPPENSTGVPHIIEHTVLCGSKKYPTKDPFVELVKGSLNTFLNAMTYPDKTVYPVASTNETDFRNLMDVYMDAVLHPNIYQYEEIFRQEGWHYEMKDPSDDLTINGVVYNEMKGAFSSPDDMLDRQIMNSLYPDTAYGVESGGDPKNIPDLTYEEFLNFHRRYYHPVNAYIYIYGNTDMEEQLRYLDENYLRDYDRIELDSEVKRQEAFSEQKEVEISYPIGAEEDTKAKTYLSMNFVAGDALNAKLYEAFDVLDYALLSAPGAPLRQAIIDAGIGNDVSGGYQTAMLQPYYSIVVKGSEPEKKQAFMDLVKKVLMEQVEKGLDPDTLLAALNSAEFKYREADFGSYPKGLIYGLGILDSWIYDKDDPFLHLKELSVIEELKKEIGTGYYEDLIRKYFLNNPHSSVVLALPKPGLAGEEEKKLADQLAKKKASMSEEQIQRIVDETAHLKEYQDTPSTQEELETIPLLSRRDLKKTVREITGKIHLEQGIPVVYTDKETNGIDYLNILFDAGEVGLTDAPAFAFGMRLLGLLNTEKYSYRDFSTQVNLHTGSMAADVRAIRTDCGDRDPLPGAVTKGYRFFADIRTKFMYHEADSAMKLLAQMLFTSDFGDKKRIREVLMEEKSALEMRFMSSGNAIASVRGSARFSIAAAYNDATGGVDYYRFLQDFAEHYDERIEDFQKKIREMMQKVFTRNHLVLHTVGKTASMQLIRDYMSEGLGRLYPDHKEVIPQIDLGDKPLCEAIKTSAAVNYIGRVGNFVNKNFAYTGAMKILRVILSYDYLWINIRVKGGAYGCGSNFLRSGMATFTTYRDPNLRASNEVFDKIPEYLRNFDVSRRDMTKYVIGAISNMDTPLTPASVGQRDLTSILTGVSYDKLQKEREQILDAEVEDIRALADAIEAALSDNCIVAIGNEDAIEKDADLFDKIESLNA